MAANGGGDEGSGDEEEQVARAYAAQRLLDAGSQVGRRTRDSWLCHQIPGAIRNGTDFRLLRQPDESNSCGCGSEGWLQLHEKV